MKKYANGGKIKGTNLPTTGDPKKDQFLGWYDKASGKVDLTPIDEDPIFNLLSIGSGLVRGGAKTLSSLPNKLSYANGKGIWLPKEPRPTVSGVVKEGALEVAKLVNPIFAYGGTINTNNMRKYAFGSKINPSLNGGDVATTLTSTGSGILSGIGTGAALGSIVPGAGTLVGAIAGGTIGLVSGLIKASASSKSRAALKESNRQATIQNMNSRLDADNLSPIPIGRKSFYAGGGVVPIGSNGQQFVGPSHEDGGIPYTANDEVEGGETGKVSPEGVKVFSDRIKVPNTKMTFADMSLKIMRAKAKLEAKIGTNENDIKDILDGIKKESRLVTLNTAKRRVQIKANESAKLLSESNMLDAQLDALFNIQETINGDIKDPDNDSDNDSSMQTDTDGDVQKHGFGDFIKANPEMSANIGGTILDTIGQSINAHQVAKLPVPVRGMAPRIRMNANIDNSAELEDINSRELATKDFITNNITNPGMRRAAIINTMINANKSRSQLFSNTKALESKIQMQNAEYARNEIAINSNNLYQNQVDNYNKAISGFNTNSAIATNFLTNVRTIGTQQAQNNSQKIALLSVLSTYPESERKLIMGNINKIIPGFNLESNNTPTSSTKIPFRNIPRYQWYGNPDF